MLYNGNRRRGSQNGTLFLCNMCTTFSHNKSFRAVAEGALRRRLSVGKMKEISNRPVSAQLHVHCTAAKKHQSGQVVTIPSKTEAERWRYKNCNVGNRDLYTKFIILNSDHSDMADNLCIMFHSSLNRLQHCMFMSNNSIRLLYMNMYQVNFE